MFYLYGMRLRGFSIGCQPMDGLVERRDDTSGKYWDVLVYRRELTADEARHYALDFISVEVDIDETLEYYGFATLEDFGASVGLREVDARRLLARMYEEDTAPLWD